MNTQPKKLITTTQNVRLVRNPVTGLWEARGECEEKQEIVAKEVLGKRTQQKETPASIIAKSAVLLAQVGIETPRRDAEILLAFAMNLTIAQLYQIWTIPISTNVLSEFEKLIQQRAKHVPVAYITGTAFFYGLELAIDNRVLIPRPETELMVDSIIEYAKGWNEVTQYLILADVGAGSGCISIAVAKALNFLKIYAIDISDNILNLAEINALKYSVKQSITFLKGNLLEPLPEPAHIIVANLPYIRNDEYPMLPKEVRDFEPKEALLSGDDGLWHIRSLLQQAPEKLLKGGKIFLEIGEKQGEKVKTIANEALPLANVTIRKDLAGKDRVVIIETG